MKKKVAYRIIAITFIVVAILTILMILTPLPNQQKNGFKRNFISKELKPLENLSLDASFNSISGMTQNTIFLGGENPFAILMLDKHLAPIDTLLIKLNIPLEKIVPFRVYIDSPWIYLHFNNMKTIVSGKFPGQKLNLNELKTPIFVKSIQISPNSCVIKTLDLSNKKQVIQKVNIETGDIIKETDISEQSNSDWMASDGILDYEPITAKLVYVEYERNRFYFIDSNLNIIRKGQTIDTITTNQVKLTKETEVNGKIKMVPSSARKIVNKGCFIGNNNLYVISALRADNETLKDFNRSTTIDSYNISTGIYNGSFRIPNNNNGDIKSVFVRNDSLTALFEKKLITFSFPQ